MQIVNKNIKVNLKINKIFPHFISSVWVIGKLSLF